MRGGACPTCGDLGYVQATLCDKNDTPVTVSCPDPFHDTEAAVPTPPKRTLAEERDRRIVAGAAPWASLPEAVETYYLEFRTRPVTQAAARILNRIAREVKREGKGK